MTIEKLKYPIGQFVKPQIISNTLVADYIETIASFPIKLKKEVSELTNEQLDTSYRPDGWTIRQVVNHCADSHMNSLIRLKLALTENNPTIKPYLEASWAELADSKTMPIEPALKIIEGVHERWTILLKSLSENDFKRTFIHPESGKQYELYEYLGLYDWHCKHHLAHIVNLKTTKGWNN